MNPPLQRFITYFDIHSAPPTPAAAASSVSAQPGYSEEPLRYASTAPTSNEGLLNAGGEFVAELANQTGNSTPPVPSSKPPMKRYSFLQWLTLFAGIAIQPFFSHYQSNQTFWGAVSHPWQWLVFACVVAAIVFPAIYRRTFVDDSPVWLQMIPIFTAGIGWNTLLNTAIAGATNIAGATSAGVPHV